MTDLSEPIILNDGISMPRIGYGTYKVGDDEAQRTVETALQLGYRLIDTAEMYGNEVGVGRGIANARLDRDSVFLTSKVWNDHHGRDAARRALEASLERLGTDYLDLLLIHWPSPKQGLYVETFQALLQAKEEGLIRSAGVSNFLPEHLERVHKETGVWPSVNQVELHPYFNQAELRAWHAERGIATESWGPLGQRTGSLLHERPIVEAATFHEKTAAQVIIRWHLQRDCAVILVHALGMGRLGDRAAAEAVAGHIADHDGPVTLIAHSGAGALLPSIAEAVPQTEAAVFVDALLPHPGDSWFDTVPPPTRERLLGMVEEDRLPRWTDWFPPEAIAELLPDRDQRRRFTDEMPQVPLAYFRETAPDPAAWPPERCAYLRLSDAYRDEAAEAERLGWPVRFFDCDHLSIMTMPDAVTAILAEFIGDAP